MIKIFFFQLNKISVRHFDKNDEKLMLKKFEYGLTKDVKYKRPAIVDWNGTDESRKGKGNDGANHQTLNNDQCIHTHIHIEKMFLCMLNNSCQCDFFSVGKTSLNTRIAQKRGFLYCPIFLRSDLVNTTLNVDLIYRYDLILIRPVLKDLCVKLMS